MTSAANTSARLGRRALSRRAAGVHADSASLDTSSSHVAMLDAGVGL